jgi:hypothetical protein
MSRSVPPLLVHVFQDTGREVQIRKLSPFIRDDVAASIRKKDKAENNYPMPPMAAGVEGKLEPNDSDPDYNVAKQQYERRLPGRIQEQLLRVSIHRGIEIEFTEEIKNDISLFKAQMAANGVEINPEVDDKELYVTRICIGSNDDLQELHDALFKRSLPTREAIEAEKATFPGDVSG